MQSDCSVEELQRAGKTSVALDKMMVEHNLGFLAYYYKDSGVQENEVNMSSIILGTSLLAARNIPVAGEYEIKNAQPMKIMDCFGVGGSFIEYYAMDFKDDVVLMGHDESGHLKIAEGKIKVKPLQVYHGKEASGLSVEIAVKRGSVTLLLVGKTQDRKLQLLVAEGESVPRQKLEIDNPCI